MFSYLRTLTTWHCPHSAAARRCCSNRSIPPRWAHSSKSAAAGLLLCAHAGTDSRTDTLPFHRPCSTYYASTANKKMKRFSLHVWLQVTGLVCMHRTCFSSRRLGAVLTRCTCHLRWCRSTVFMPRLSICHLHVHPCNQSTTHHS